MLDLSLHDKTALVTGASGGLGLHFARVLAAQGASVVLTARRAERVAEAARSIRDAGGQARARALDVTDADGVTALLAQSDPFDIVINNAGIANDGRALDQPIADFDAVMATNVRGVFLVAQAAAQGMARAGQGGSIVNVASILGHRVAGNVAAYATSKAAVVQMSAALALEWARHGIRVNALCPGYIETDINAEFFAGDVGQAMIRRIPQRRLGRADDLDGALCLLCSDAGAYITGTSLVVDGGHLVSSL